MKLVSCIVSPSRSPASLYSWKTSLVPKKSSLALTYSVEANTKPAGVAHWKATYVTCTH